MLFIFDWDGTLCDSTGKIVRCMQLASRKVGFRVGPGLRDRVIYRELFPFGLTVADLSSEIRPVSVSLAHVADLVLFSAPTTEGQQVFCIADLRAESVRVGSPRPSARRDRGNHSACIRSRRLRPVC